MWIDVAIDAPLPQLFSYEVPAKLRAQMAVGVRVLVPFGKKSLVGTCLAISESLSESQTSSGITYKPIIEILGGFGPLAKDFLSLTYWEWLKFAADYYYAPLGQVIANAVPRQYYDAKKPNAKSRIRVKAVSNQNDFASKKVMLSSEQLDAVAKISSHFGTHHPVLLHGITGSGKTEVYIELMSKILAQNQSVIYLVPEIGLTPQTKSRLASHFYNELLIYHSDLTPNERRLNWDACLSDAPKIMMGTRSALFAPFKNLGLIIIDEEHDHSFKQDERFRYHARDLALVRAQMQNVPIILGSATPSLESIYLAQEKKFQYLTLSQRHAGGALPNAKIINYQIEKQSTQNVTLVSQHIHEQIAQAKARGEQSMIFVAQRGFSQTCFCTECEAVIVCPNCSVGLKHHRQNQSAEHLKCHFCNYEEVFAPLCRTCQKPGRILLGFGTQSVCDEIRQMHPQIHVCRFDSDAMSGKNKQESALKDFFDGKIDCLVGTQMLTKGHDFSRVTFVGILGVESLLSQPDFRANERSFQTIVQVAGRAGRAEKRGSVILQTLIKNNQTMIFALQNKYQEFAAQELATRKTLLYPPYSRLVEFKFSAGTEAALKQVMPQLARVTEKYQANYDTQSLKILGPAPMSIYKLRNQFRYHVLIKIKRGLRTKDIIAHYAKTIEALLPNRVRMQIDVDPINLG